LLRALPRRAARRCRIATWAAVSAFPISPATLRSTSPRRRGAGRSGSPRCRQAGRHRFCIELGRYLVGEAGVYLTRIVDRKVSHGEVFPGHRRRHASPAGRIGQLRHRGAPQLSRRHRHALWVEPVEEEASVVGCLCTPLDVLADKAGFPRAEVGDLVAVFCAGAYGASASPAFLGHGPAREMLV
jgi:diaminopimelate decarboxylase